jgi:hypothetical protein
MVCSKLLMRLWGCSEKFLRALQISSSAHVRQNLFTGTGAQVLQLEVASELGMYHYYRLTSLHTLSIYVCFG